MLLEGAPGRCHLELCLGRVGGGIELELREQERVEVLVVPELRVDCQRGAHPGCRGLLHQHFLLAQAHSLLHDHRDAVRGRRKEGHGRDPHPRQAQPEVRRSLFHPHELALSQVEILGHVGSCCSEPQHLIPAIDRQLHCLREVRLDPHRPRRRVQRVERRLMCTARPGSHMHLAHVRELPQH
eukprot:3864571-Rhodomonas_salina.3